MRRISVLVLGALAMAAAGDDVPKVDLHGAGWLQGGRVEASSELPEATNDYTKNWIGQAGGLMSMHSRLDPEWDCGLGLGTVLTQLARGSRGQSGKWYLFTAPWVDEARVGYAQAWDELSAKVDMGIFHYGYNPDIKNFGQYLMHGYVYPGALVTSLTGPLGVNQDLTGILAGVKWRGLGNEFIVNMETEDKPYYDVSVADVLSWKIAKGLEVGAGINLYRVLPSNEKATSPGKDCTSGQQGIDAFKSNQSNTCFILDSVGVDPSGAAVYDTITGSLSGVKLMGRIRVDPKALMGLMGLMDLESGRFGKNDWVVYSELAVLGLKDYPIYYDNILQRIPVMVGINLPGFGYFDWSVEVQYYASKFTGDNLGAQNGVWLPVLDPGRSGKRDDWKYSLNASKLVRGHILFMGQIANDDLRLGGYHYEPAGKEAMRTPMDWYWAAKLGYFF